jgi:DNA polymerase iota
LLHLRLLLASHLAEHIRHRLETEIGYTATVGISTNKLIAKLVGNRHKPNGQTTLLPPYSSANGAEDDNVTSFIDDHEVGKIPGIGFKVAQKLRAHVLQRPADFDAGLVYGGTKEKVLVRDVRRYPEMGPETLERLLGGPGTPHGIGARIWELLNGCDSTEVGRAREVPTQISIEDSYLRLDTLDEVIKQLRMLANSLLRRMHTDLLEEDGGEDRPDDSAKSKRWLAHPKAIRLSTRPRPPQNPDGSRNRSFARISKSAPMPGFVFSLKDSVDALAERLLNETLLPLFRRLHPEKSGWNLSLMNVAAANMSDAASEKGGVGRDIAKMFRKQDDVLKQWRVTEPNEKEGEGMTEEPKKAADIMEDENENENENENRNENEEMVDLPLDQAVLPRLTTVRTGSEDVPTPSQGADAPIVDQWDSADEDMVDADFYRCGECGATMPMFAYGAHQRYHASIDAD